MKLFSEQQINDTWYAAYKATKNQFESSGKYLLGGCNTNREREEYLASVEPVHGEGELLLYKNYVKHVEYGRLRGQLPMSFEDYAKTDTICKPPAQGIEWMELKEFPVQRMSNHNGQSNLVVILEPAIEDVEIGRLIQVPYVNGYKDPVKVVLMVDEKGEPLRNGDFAIPEKYIYAH